MHFLITGGAGFLGSHLTDALVARGDEVTVLDDLSTGRARNLSPAAGLAFVEGSVLDRDLVERLTARADCAVHLAAKVGVRLILDSPRETIETNVEGTRHVLDACARHGKRVLLASSSEVYGLSEELPFREDAPVLRGATSEPRWCYASSKELGERLALAYARESGLDVRIARFFNVVGPRQRGRYGMVLPNFVRQALSGEPITVFGDGTQTRSFLHVADWVRAVSSLLEVPAARGEVVNVGSPREVAIERVGRLVRERLASSSPIVHMPYREVYGIRTPDLVRRVPDTAKLEALTGFRAELSLEEAIDDLARERGAVPSR
ncbi:MAG TPA: NAD-dependent epimerase/dehydratase family protein [Planctomycetes bacterium]|nr:NAD-dependent epimerase/dehydratase family protein [Planctomycetota bacterium]